MLTLSELNVGYESIVICRDVSLTIDQGEAVCLLGRNGMGKTTLLEGILGMNTYHSGRILFFEEDVSQLPIHQRIERGIGLVPQGRRIFGNISVRDNLHLGSLVSKENDVKEEILDVIYEFFPILYERLEQSAETLSGGEQQMLAIARALAGDPDILLLDEPSEGLAPMIVDLIADLIIHLIEEKDIAVLIAEQNLGFALDVTERGYVMEKGSIVASEKVDKLQDNELVREYLMV